MSLFLIGLLVPFAINGSASGTTAPSAGAAPVAHASFAQWQWVGSGDPCTRGSSGDWVASFNGSATGGLPPYRFSWTFDDGSNASTDQNPQHVFLGGPHQLGNDSRNASGLVGWKVTLTVTDSAAVSANSSVNVTEIVIHCPAEFGPPGPNGWSGWPFVVVMLAIGVSGVGVAVAILSTYRRPRA